MDASAERQSPRFGQLVIGPPGSGKSTYCFGMHQFLTALDRPISIINLDPANDSLPYPCAVNISSLITLQDVMDEFGLGPNGAMLYCMEYLERNLDWLEERIDELGRDAYVVFDVAGQVELSTNHMSLKRIVERLGKRDFRLAAVHLTDAHYVTDPSKYISVLLLSLRTMLQLELPHVNVLSKVDLITSYGDLPFNLDYYTEVQDLSYLSHDLDRMPHGKKFAQLNKAICELIEDFGLVGFETLCVEDKTSMTRLLRTLDKATGYVYAPSTPIGAPPAPPQARSLFSAAARTAGPGNAVGFGEVGDVQERWVDHPEVYDAWDKKVWREEGEEVRRQEAVAAAAAAAGTNTVGGEMGEDEGVVMHD
uniref:GPN-loop GTPase 2 n=1 Tax=Bartheletia paradoxa TaxID=669517 RepID=A0A2D0XHX7_9BASI|nr:hypothetical protein SPAR03058 [Bartheletia paradoxa]